jgi:hypothetical protein
MLDIQGVWIGYKLSRLTSCHTSTQTLVAVISGTVLMFNASFRTVIHHSVSETPKIIKFRYTQGQKNKMCSSSAVSCTWL